MNLTAILVVVSFLELVVNRLLGRLFLSPACQTGLACVALRTGPLLLHLTGMLTLIVVGGGVLSHLRRGELFPRGMRLTVAALSTVFLSLLALSLVLGRMPERYHVHLETSFGFVVALLLLSFVGSSSISRRARVGFLLFAAPVLLHMTALVAARAGWWTQSAFGPERLTAAGERVLLAAAAASPALLLPRNLSSRRMGAALALAAGFSAFVFVALLGRSDLMQTVALYGVQLELPRALSIMGGVYTIALFGFVTSASVLLLSRGASRLAGLGLALLASAGYQTTSAVALSVTFGGLLALATGLERAGAPAVRAATLKPTPAPPFDAALP